MERLDEEAVARALTTSEWDLVDGKLTRTRQLTDFAEAIHYVNAVAEVAEARNHHPDIAVHWNEVTFMLWTHDAHGITQADLDLAEAIDRVA